ncbi:MAG: TIGR01777 family oxidoreductase [Terriglobia bacterium]
MQILVTGAGGLIGSEVVSRLTANGHQVLRLSRSPSSPDQISWDPEAGRAPSLPDGALDAVIHLAGENISSRRWDEKKKAHIRDSRVKGVRLLCQSLIQLKKLPRTLLIASAVGYYGNRGDEILTEQSPPGSGFLAGVCRDLEAEADAATQKGIRTVILRFGVVLSAWSGALPVMARPFRMGLGGVLGGGRQFMSWIALEDAVGVIETCLRAESLSGPVIAASPNPARNREFAKTLGRTLRRPVWAPVPSFALRLALGEMAEELLLSSQRADPVILKSTGYLFRFPELEGALRNLLLKRD